MSRLVLCHCTQAEVACSRPARVVMGPYRNGEPSRRHSVLHSHPTMRPAKASMTKRGMAKAHSHYHIGEIRHPQLAGSAVSWIVLAQSDAVRYRMTSMPGNTCTSTVSNSAESRAGIIRCGSVYQSWL